MSEYTLTSETSVSVAITASNVVPVWQGSVLRKATITDLQTGVMISPTISGGTANSPTINTPLLNGVASVSSSFVLAATKSAKVGFYGAAGTSQRAGSAQAAFTGSAFSPSTASSVVGFSSSAQFVNLYTLVNEMRTVLVDAGLMNGS